MKDSANADNEESIIESQLDMLDAEINGVSVGDKEPVPDDNEDEIAGDVAASDAIAVDNVICKADMSICLDALSADQANLSHVSIAKVRLWLLLAHHSKSLTHPFLTD